MSSSRNINSRIFLSPMPVSNIWFVCISAFVCEANCRQKATIIVSMLLHFITKCTSTFFGNSKNLLMLLPCRDDICTSWGHSDLHEPTSREICLKLYSFSRFKLAHSYLKNNLHTNELNTTFFCSKSPLKASNRLKSLKLAWRFVLTSCDIYQNPFTQEKILKFWQCRTKIV
jgi:hypothetical protein